MVFKFHSIAELKEFLAFINQDKDDIIKEETKLLNKSSKELQAAVDNSTKVGVNK